MIEMYLVRHGETDWNLQGRLQGQEDIPLNETGLKQAQDCGKALRDIKFDKIFTSPLSRAKGTAAAIAQYQSCNAVDDPGLLERDYGHLSGLDAAQREAFAATGQPDGAEPWEELARRVIPALESCAEQTGEGRRGLIVSHGAWINALLAVLSHHEIGSGKTVLKNTCVSVLRRGDRGWEIVSYNQLPGEILARKGQYE